MELYRKVRLACADGVSKRAAARHFNISRHSVDKIQAFSAPLCYRRTSPIKRPKLDGFTAIIDAWLDGDWDVHRKQHHTAKRVFDRLREENGFTVSVRSDCPVCMMEWLIVSTMGSGHLEVGDGGEEGVEEAGLV